MRTFRIRPDERLHPDFPWQAFAAGWLAIGKGVAWLFSELAIPGEAGRLILLHLSLFGAGFVLCGIGVWNLRRWGQIGIITLASANLAIFFFFNYYAILGLQHESFFFAKTFMLITGPIGDIGLLGFVLTASSHFGKDHGIEKQHKCPCRDHRSRGRQEIKKKDDHCCPGGHGNSSSFHYPRRRSRDLPLPCKIRG